MIALGFPDKKDKTELIVEVRMVWKKNGVNFQNCYDVGHPIECQTLCTKRDPGGL